MICMFSTFSYKLYEQQVTVSFRYASSSALSTLISSHRWWELIASLPTFNALTSFHNLTKGIWGHILIQQQKCLSWSAHKGVTTQLWVTLSTWHSCGLQWTSFPDLVRRLIRDWPKKRHWSTAQTSRWINTSTKKCFMLLISKITVNTNILHMYNLSRTCKSFIYTVALSCSVDSSPCCLVLDR